MNFFFILPTNACSSTFSIVATGIIFTISLYRSSMSTSFRFDWGINISLIPACAAASTFAVTPPTGRTSPRTDKEPVIAKLWSTGISSREDITAVAIDTLAESPSTPSYVPTNWICISLRERSFPVIFLNTAETFCTASCAISCNLPVAITRPSSLDCAGVTSAIIGSMTPESPITASPFTRPTSTPSVLNN